MKIVFSNQTFLRGESRFECFIVGVFASNVSFSDGSKIEHVIGGDVGQSGFEDGFIEPIKIRSCVGEILAAYFPRCLRVRFPLAWFS